ncbi:MAG: hypothetical protein ACO3G9_01190 [Chthoniobacterales bacterium]
MIKKLLTLFAGVALVAPMASAQVETGTSAGAAALDRSRSAPVSAGETAATTETVVVSDGKSLNKKIVIEEEPEKWWSVNVSTGWDSLYMFRGANLLGNGRGLYWLGGDVSITPWENGALTAGVWYGTSTSSSREYNELNVFVDYTHSFGALDASFGWVYYYYPNNFGLGGADVNQNELYWALAYNLEVGPFTITPNATYFLNVGPDITNGGWTKPGASYLLLQIDASASITDWLAVEPWVAYGLNFGFNSRNNGSFWNGGNNFELGLALPIQITSWFGVSPYVAYSYQWEDIIGTDENTWWAGVSANFSF